MTVGWCRNHVIPIPIWSDGTGCQDIVIVTGGFDPIHSGHVNYLQAAKSLGGWLTVGINSDEWLIRKKGSYFLPFSERRQIISALRWVDETQAFNDGDGSATMLIKDMLRLNPGRNIIFANGGDRTDKNIPEMSDPEIADNPRLKFMFGIGGETKLNSSSELLKRWRTLNQP